METHRSGYVRDSFKNSPSVFSKDSYCQFTFEWGDSLSPVFFLFPLISSPEVCFILSHIRPGFQVLSIQRWTTTSTTRMEPFPSILWLATSASFPILHIMPSFNEYLKIPWNFHISAENFCVRCSLRNYLNYLTESICLHNAILCATWLDVCVCVLQSYFNINARYWEAKGDWKCCG